MYRNIYLLSSDFDSDFDGYVREYATVGKHASQMFGGREKKVIYSTCNFCA